MVSFWNLCTCRVNTKKPHIVFMVADDLGYNDVGYHGSEINTPTIDNLANNGMFDE